MNCFIDMLCVPKRWSKKDKPILNLIQKRRWSSVRLKLESDFTNHTAPNNGMVGDGGGVSHQAATMTTTVTSTTTPTLASTRDNNYANNESILHIACRNQPPLEIIQLIIEKCPNFISTMTTKEKQYPIHLAAVYGAHPAVISFLIDKYPPACCSDYKGRTPLHLACQNYATHYKEDKPVKGEDPPLFMEEAMLQTVRILTRKCPKMVNATDDDDMTALEYAICGNIHLEIVQSIQRATERFLKAEREKSQKQGIVRSSKSMEDPRSKSLHSGIVGDKKAGAGAGTSSGDDVKTKTNKKSRDNVNTLMHTRSKSMVETATRTATTHPSLMTSLDASLDISLDHNKNSMHHKNTKSENEDLRTEASITIEKEAQHNNVELASGVVNDLQQMNKSNISGSNSNHDSNSSVEGSESTSKPLEEFCEEATTITEDIKENDSCLKQENSVEP
jgi:hypothetical protein